MGRPILSPAYTYNADRCNGKCPLQAVAHGLRVVFINAEGPWRTDGSFDTKVLDRALQTFRDAPGDLGVVIRFTVTTDALHAMRNKVADLIDVWTEQECTRNAAR